MPLPIHLRAQADGRAARRRGEPRDHGPYLDRYQGPSGARKPADWWLLGWDMEDEVIAFEESRPTLPGDDMWRPVKRLHPDSAR